MYLSSCLQSVRFFLNQDTPTYMYHLSRDLNRLETNIVYNKYLLENKDITNIHTLKIHWLKVSIYFIFFFFYLKLVLRNILYVSTDDWHSFNFIMHVWCTSRYDTSNDFIIYIHVSGAFLVQMHTLVHYICLWIKKNFDVERFYLLFWTVRTHRRYMRYHLQYVDIYFRRR